MDWFRWWHGTVTDPKFQWVARKSGQTVASVLAVWAVVLETGSTATQCNADATRGNVASLQCNDWDVALGLDDGAVQSIFNAMEEKGLIVGGMIATWEKRQPKREDAGNPNTGALSSTERSRARRERLKRDETDATQCNADATHATQMQRLDKIREDIETTMSGKPDATTEIIGYLNEKTGRRFGFVKANLDLVKARLKEGATVETIKAVIDAKVKAWKGDPKMDEYLRPETLFGARKFAQYSGQLGSNGKADGDWWTSAGFAKEWQATNAGCTAVSAHLWRDGQKAEV